MNDGFDRGANLVGALSLALADRMSDAITSAAEQPDRPGSDTGAEALSALHHFLDDPTVDRLRQVLGLSSSGTVRLVDRLQAAGYVERRPGADGRTTVLSLTRNGEAAAARVTRARHEVLANALAVLTAEQREALEAISASVLVGLIRGPGATRWTCRLCDTGVCGVRTRACPVTRAAFERYGAKEPTEAR